MQGGSWQKVRDILQNIGIRMAAKWLKRMRDFGRGMSCNIHAVKEINKEVDGQE